MATSGTSQSSKKARATRTPPPGKPFTKGVSGNPGGRKKIPEDVKAALAKMTMPAVKRLAELLKSFDEKVAIRAVEVVLERNLGKVVQPVTGEDGQPIVFQINAGPAK